MRPRKRYAGDWIPVDRAAVKKGRARRRHKPVKSQMQLISEQNRRNSY